MKSVLGSCRRGIGKTRRYQLTMILLIGFGALMPSACGDDPADLCANDRQVYPLLLNADQVVRNLHRAYEELNFAEYEKLLHKDFLFYFAEQDIDLSPAGQGYWDRSVDLISTLRMFSGESGTSPDGKMQAPVEHIALELLALDEDWTTATDPDFAGTLQARFEAVLDVTHADGEFTRVTGEQRFYVTSEDIQLGQATVRLYRLKFWRDMGPAPGSASSEKADASWGALKALFSSTSRE